MILQALNDLFSRLSKDPDYELPSPGYSVQKVTFRIVIHPDGRLHAIEDARDTKTEQTRGGATRARQFPRQMLLPGNAKPPGQGFNPCTLWDNTSYILGYKAEDPKKPSNPEREGKSRQAFMQHHLDLEKEANDPDFSSVCRFLEDWAPERIAAWKTQLDDFCATGFGVFQIVGKTEYVHETDRFKEWWEARRLASEPSEVKAPCLITGEVSPIARLADPAIKGVGGAAPGGAKLASFNQNAFESYGKEQTYNSPVSEKATFQYCNALNALLSGPRSSKHRVVIGDATTVFWTEKPTVTESIFARFLSGGREDGQADAANDPVLSKKLEVFLNTLRKASGISDLGDDPTTKFFILGLSGNVTRLSVRFWHVSTIAQMADRLRTHFDALRIEPRSPKDPEFPPLWLLLRQTGREADDIPPLLSGALMNAILNGSPYPQAFYNAVLNRIRADHTVNYIRACAIKAFLSRLTNPNPPPPMSLDIERTDIGYLLGRLFAALEKTQEDALDIATVRERFYSAASATPSAVFPRILRTYQHWLAKVGSELGKGAQIKREQLVQEISAKMSAYPPHLTLEGQGNFAIGYYHQRQAFFTKKSETPES